MSFAKLLRAWFARLAGLFHKKQRDAEFAAELESHLQLHIEDNLRRGMTPEGARRHALMKLGGLEQTRENYRNRRGVPVLEALVLNLRFGARMLLKSPGFGRKELHGDRHHAGLVYVSRTARATMDARLPRGIAQRNAVSG